MRMLKSPHHIPVLSFLFLLVFIYGCNNSDKAGGKGPVIQVGDNLNGITPNNQLACNDGSPIFTTFAEPVFLSKGIPTCLLVTFFNGAQPSTPGTVVSANIKIGNITGPMRFVRARLLVQNLFSGPNKACCSVEQYGEIFTPTPNSITTVPLNFNMAADHAPAPNDLVTIAAADLVGLEVLAPGVPIPGTWLNNGLGVLTLPNYFWLPAMSARSGTAGPSQNLRSEGSFSGFLPSYNLNFQANVGSAVDITGANF
jgi:hypothetical protein